MDMRKEFVYAAIFSTDDVRDSFIDCITTVIDECSEAIILVESQSGIDRIAEVFGIYESGEPRLSLRIYPGAARQYGIDAEATETLFNVAAIIKGNMRASFEESLKIAKAIAENYTISHK